MQQKCCKYVYIEYMKTYYKDLCIYVLVDNYEATKLYR